MPVALPVPSCRWRGNQTRLGRASPLRHACHPSWTSGEGRSKGGSPAPDRQAGPGFAACLSRPSAQDDKGKDVEPERPQRIPRQKPLAGIPPYPACWLTSGPLVDAPGCAAGVTGSQRGRVPVPDRRRNAAQTRHGTPAKAHRQTASRTPQIARGLRRRQMPPSAGLPSLVSVSPSGASTTIRGQRAGLRRPGRSTSGRRFPRDSISPAPSPSGLPD